MVDQVIDSRQSSALSGMTTSALSGITSSTSVIESENYSYFDPKLLQGSSIKEYLIFLF